MGAVVGLTFPPVDAWPHPAPSAEERAAVEALLGRPAGGLFTVVVWSDGGEPVVIRNFPIMEDGRPMPTLYWLLGRRERAAVGRLESAGGVAAAEAAVAPTVLDDAHRRYGAERDVLVPAEHTGPRPAGGVGGTRRGVKCLHAHYGWFLAGGDDPVGRWVDGQLRADGPEPVVR